MSRLPAELVFLVIEYLIPANPPVAFPASHLVTRTLASLTLVSKLTFPIARRLLIKHCLYIDVDCRLDKLVDCGLLPLIGKDTSHASPALDATPVGLYLSPFPDNSLNEPHIAKQVDKLSSKICDCLTRLVIDIPLRLLWPTDDHQCVRPLLRAAFARLTTLQEFCSVRDELYCSTTEDRPEPALWASWPHLQRLALYNVDVSSADFLEGLRCCPTLTHLVLTRADGLLGPISQESSDSGLLPCLRRILIVDTEAGHQASTATDDIPEGHTSFYKWIHLSRCTSDPDTIVASRTYELLLSYVTVPVLPDREDEDIQLCQEWVSDRATDGTLWNLTGTPILADK